MFDINKYPKKLGNQLAIYQHNNHIDVFYGEGWASHVRFTKKRTPSGTHLTKATQQAIPTQLYQQILQEIKKCTLM